MQVFERVSWEAAEETGIHPARGTRVGLVGATC